MNDDILDLLVAAASEAASTSAPSQQDATPDNTETAISADNTEAAVFALRAMIEETAAAVSATPAPALDEREVTVTFHAGRRPGTVVATWFVRRSGRHMEKFVGFPARGFRPQEGETWRVRAVEQRGKRGRLWDLHPVERITD